jgi:NCAIR mutase (PurE)-related protein
MHPDRLRSILEAVSSGQITIDQAQERLRLLPFEDLGFAQLDHHRSIRRGFPEVVFGQGKTPEQIARLAARLARQGQNVLVTRTTEDAYRAVAVELPSARWHPEARAVVVETTPAAPLGGPVLVISAGTSDIPVAEEAALTASTMGARVERLLDVGVAGLHRLTGRQNQLAEARVLIVVAGMEGALPSVVAGLVAAPVIAVPTSIGYGASLGGIAALLAMLNSCASGVAVVNIDNGFGAGYLAGLMLTRLGGGPVEKMDAKP